MNTPAFTLYVDAQFTSPYAMSAFVALTEKKLPFQLRTVDLTLQHNHLPEYARLSMTHRVPTLSEGEFHLSESSAITEYLEERFAPPAYTALYPQALQHKAKAREIQAWLRSDLMPIREERPTTVIFLGEKRPPLSSAAQFAAAKLIAAADAWLDEGSECLFGAWSIADLDLAVMLSRLARHGDALPAKLSAYVDRQWQRPSAQQWLKLLQD
ncbi:glutathione transferase [Herbaspirillum sp. RV1423]|uniref:glutathione transferase n=1 Tax=Herbaspirillum sp. RV1423 TaxID=1443993 RepID=UPI0004B46DA0|nr:glutathione transferase [Herbaspirillum sp. RV1423]